MGRRGKDTLKKSAHWEEKLSSYAVCNCFLQVRSQSIFPTDTIDDLAPDTTYCLKVQATLPLEFQEGLFSPIRCVKTTRKGTE